MMSGMVIYRVFIIEINGDKKKIVLHDTSYKVYMKGNDKHIQYSSRYVCHRTE